MANLLKKTKKNSVWVLIGTFSEHISGFAITWLLVKLLPIEEYGVYNLFLGTVMYLGIVSSFGLKNSFQRYLPEFFQKKEYGQFLWTVKFGVVFRFFAAIIVIGIVIYFFDFLGPFLKVEDYYDYFLIFALGLIFLFQFKILRIVLESMFLHKYVTYLQLIHAILRLILIFLVYVFDFGLLEVLIVDIIANVVTLACCIIYFFIKRTRFIKGEHADKNFSKTQLAKRIFRYSGFSMFNEMGKGFLDLSTDFIVIAHFLGPAVVAYYALATRLGRLVSKLLPSRAMRSIVAPVFYAHYAETGDMKQIGRMFQFLSKLNAFIIFPVITVFAVYGEKIIQHVFDPKYLEAYPVLLILLFHFMLLAFPTGMPLKAVEKPEIILIGKLSSIYNLVMDIVLIQVWGIVGVAIATTSAALLKKLFEYRMAKKLTGMTIPVMSILKLLLNCLIMGALGYWLENYINGIPSLLIMSMLIMGVYLGISYFNKLFVKEEQALIQKKLGIKYFVF